MIFKDTYKVANLSKIEYRHTYLKTPRLVSAFVSNFASFRVSLATSDPCPYIHSFLRASDLLNSEPVPNF